MIAPVPVHYISITFISSIMTVSDKCKLALFVLLQDAAHTQFCDHFTEILMAIHLTLLFKNQISLRNRCRAVSVCPMDEHMCFS